MGSEIDRFMGDRYKAYLAQQILRHEGLLWGKEDFAYATKRARLGSLFFLPEARRRLTHQDEVSILELGTGQGEALRATVQGLSAAERERIHVIGTSVNGMFAHKALKEQGLTIYKGVLAERLPMHWSNKFDLIGTDSVLGWTDIPWTLQEIRRILKPGGIYFGIEYLKGYDSTGPLIDVLPTTMQSLGMADQMHNSPETQQHLRSQESFGIKYIK